MPFYTRKSAEEGLEQEFNSLDAQREACAAYVASQKAEGWVLLPTVYEDAGLSEGTLERPGLQRLLDDDSASAAPLLRLIRRVDISPGSVSILLDRNTFAACLSMGPDRIREDALRILAPFRLRRRGVETKLVLGNPTKSVDRTLLRNIANALSWLDRIKAGKTYEQIATEDAIPTDRVRKAIRYAFLAPDIVRAIVEGRQPVGLTSSYLLHHPLPDDWEKQRVLIATL